MSVKNIYYHKTFHLFCGSHIYNISTTEYDMKKYFIVTGASRGLGRAFTEKLLQKDHVLFLISRSEIPGIATQAILKNCNVNSISFDLSDLDHIPKLISNIFDHINDDCKSVHLINNAGVTEPVMPIDQAAAGAIEKHVQVNYLAPVYLTAGFIRHAEKFNVPKSILNITSGAAGIPHHGMSLYCSTKAALDQFTRSVALEQSKRESPVEIHAISPGFVDTEMANSLLEKDQSAFPSVDQFRTSKNEGKFADANAVAEKIINLWQSGKIRHGEVSHVSDY
jgi:benzil reductase ((S)-benzoin forming)